MRYWDSSSLVPLFVEEARSRACRDVVRADRAVAVWTLTHVEVASAIRRLERNGELDDAGTAEALSRLDRARPRWTEVIAIGPVSDRATRLLAVHPLTAADALQLAAALELVGDRPRGRTFVTNDEALGRAASREGFAVIVPDR